MPRVTDEERVELAKQAKREIVAEKKEAKPLSTTGVKEMVTNAMPVTVTGVATAKEALPDPAISKMFKRTFIKKVGWIAVGEDELAEYQAQGLVIGFDPQTNEVLLKKD